LAVEELVERAAAILEEKKGADLVLVDLSDTTIPTRYFLIATGENEKHVRALAEELLERMPLSPEHEEGLPEGRWVLLDYGDFVVHIFDREARIFYDLDGLWSDKIVKRHWSPRSQAV